MGGKGILTIKSLEQRSDEKRTEGGEDTTGATNTLKEGKINIDELKNFKGQISTRNIGSVEKRDKGEQQQEEQTIAFLGGEDELIQGGVKQGNREEHSETEEPSSHSLKAE